MKLPVPKIRIGIPFHKLIPILRKEYKEVPYCKDCKHYIYRGYRDNKCGAHRRYTTDIVTGESVPHKRDSMPYAARERNHRWPWDVLRNKCGKSGRFFVPSALKASENKLRTKLN